LQLETLEKQQEWPNIEQNLKNIYFELEDLVRKINAQEHTGNLNMQKIEAHLQEFRQKTEAIIQEKNRGEAKRLIDEIGSMDFRLRNAVSGNAMNVQLLQHLNDTFHTYHWTDTARARQLINSGLQMVANGNNNVRPILVEIVKLIPKDELPPDTLA
jgi:molecular chaperone DnaK